MGKLQVIETNEYIFFYGGYLSQWFPCKFTSQEITYNCAEQYMMAEKARIFDDEETLQLILAAAHPREQKELGRQVKGFDPIMWNYNCNNVVYVGNYWKFKQNPKLLEKLLLTQGKTLVEASPDDKIWGIGMGLTDRNLLNRAAWGENRLGQVLTSVRDYWRNSNDTEDVL